MAVTFHVVGVERCRPGVTVRDPRGTDVDTFMRNLAREPDQSAARRLQRPSGRRQKSSKATKAAKASRGAKPAKSTGKAFNPVRASIPSTPLAAAVREEWWIAVQTATRARRGRFSEATEGLGSEALRRAADRAEHPFVVTEHIEPSGIPDFMEALAWGRQTELAAVALRTLWAMWESQAVFAGATVYNLDDLEYMRSLVNPCAAAFAACDVDTQLCAAIIAHVTYSCAASKRFVDLYGNEWGSEILGEWSRRWTRYRCPECSPCLPAKAADAFNARAAEMQLAGATGAARVYTVEATEPARRSM